MLLSFNIIFLRLVNILACSCWTFPKFIIYPTIKNKVGTAPRCMFWVYVLAHSTWILFGYICLILLDNWVLISSLLLSNDKLFCKVVIPMYTPTRYTCVPIALHFHQCWISLDFKIFAHQVSMQHDIYFIPLITKEVLCLLPFGVFFCLTVHFSFWLLSFSYWFARGFYIIVCWSGERLCAIVVIWRSRLHHPLGPWSPPLILCLCPEDEGRET